MVITILLLIGVLFGLFIAYKGDMVSSPLKVLPLFFYLSALILASSQQGFTPMNIIFIVGLGFFIIGDYSLAPDNPQFFLYSLTFFTIGYALNTLFFAHYYHITEHTNDLTRSIGVSCALLFSIGALSYKGYKAMTSLDRDRKIWVAISLTIFTTLVATVGINGTGFFGLIGVIGYTLILICNLIFAINTFGKPIKKAGMRSRSACYVGHYFVLLFYIHAILAL